MKGVADIPINLSVVSLFKEVFGVSIQQDNSGELPKIGRQLERNFAGTEYYSKKGVNGLEIFLPITFSYTDNNNISVDIFIRYAVISAYLSNKIVKTDLTEIAGTFKEIISGDDVTLIVSGFLISQNVNDFPEEELRELVKFKKIGKGKIINAMTDIYLFDSDFTRDIVVEDLEFPEVRGIKHVKPFRMRISTDVIFNLNSVK